MNKIISLILFKNTYEPKKKVLMNNKSEIMIKLKSKKTLIFAADFCISAVLTEKKKTHNGKNRD